MTPVIFLSRRLPRQRRRAVADPRRRAAAEDRSGTSTSRHRRRSCRTSATRDARAAVGDPRHAGPGAPHRRPREGRTSPATSATTRRTTSTWCTCAREKIAEHRAGRPGRRGDRRRDAADVLVARLGQHLRRDHDGRAARARAGQAASRRRTCATSTRCPRTSATCCKRFEHVLVPEMNLGQLRAAAPRQVSSSTSRG